jgi:hypothetical protein
MIKLMHTRMLLLAAVLTTTAAAPAQVLLTGQSLQPPSLVGVKHYDESLASIIPPTGQEFIPSLNCIDFVDVTLFSVQSAQPGTFQIAIHDSTIGGPVLGLSTPTVRTNATSDHTAHFTFENKVPLTPGATYVLEIIQTAGDTGWAVELPNTAAINGTNANLAYAGGRLINAGAPQNTNDLAFREGIFARLDFQFTQTNAIVLSWPAQIAGAVLQQTDSLNNTNWSDVNFPVSSDGTNNTVVISPPPPLAFYRLRIP